MGCSSYQDGYRGEVSRREYRTLLSCEIEPALFVDGVAKAWRRVIWSAAVTETVKEIVGLDYDAAHATGAVTVAGGVTVTLSAATTYSGGTNPVETYSRQIERVQDGDSALWIVRITERNANLEVSVTT